MRFAYLTESDLKVLNTRLAQYPDVPAPRVCFLEPRALRAQAQDLLDHLAKVYAQFIADAHQQLPDVQKQDKRRNRLSGHFTPGMPAFFQRLYNDDIVTYSQLMPSVHFGLALRHMIHGAAPLLSPLPTPIYERVVPPLSQALLKTGGRRNQDIDVIRNIPVIARMHMYESSDYMLIVARDQETNRFKAAENAEHAHHFVTAYCKLLLKGHTHTILPEYTQVNNRFASDIQAVVTTFYNEINYYTRKYAENATNAAFPVPSGQVVAFRPR
ncbi:MAG: hypothetical protein V4621_06445 [Pseudomonadota bacterium]